MPIISALAGRLLLACCLFFWIIFIYLTFESCMCNPLLLCLCFYVTSKHLDDLLMSSIVWMFYWTILMAVVVDILWRSWAVFTWCNIVCVCRWVKFISDLEVKVVAELWRSDVWVALYYTSHLLLSVYVSYVNVCVRVVLPCVSHVCCRVCYTCLTVCVLHVCYHALMWSAAASCSCAYPYPLMLVLHRPCIYTP